MLGMSDRQIFIAPLRVHSPPISHLSQHDPPPYIPPRQPVTTPQTIGTTIPPWMYGVSILHTTCCLFHGIRKAWQSGPVARQVTASSFRFPKETLRFMRWAALPCGCMYVYVHTISPCYAGLWVAGPSVGVCKVIQDDDLEFIANG